MSKKHPRTKVEEAESPENRRPTRKEHESNAIEYLQSIQALCAEEGKRFSVLCATWFWRHRVVVARAMVKAGLRIDSQKGIGDLYKDADIARWKRGTEKHRRISRHCVLAVLETRAPITVSQIEVDLDGGAGRTEITNVLNEGVELGFFKKTAGQGSKASVYVPTVKLLQQTTERVWSKCTDPDVVEFARFVTTLADMRRMGRLTREEEVKGSVTRNDHETLIERIFWNALGEEERPDKSIEMTGDKIAF